MAARNAIFQNTVFRLFIRKESKTYWRVVFVAGGRMSQVSSYRDIGPDGGYRTRFEAEIALAVALSAIQEHAMDDCLKIGRAAASETSSTPTLIKDRKSRREERQADRRMQKRIDRAINRKPKHQNDNAREG